MGNLVWMIWQPIQPMQMLEKVHVSHLVERFGPSYKSLQRNLPGLVIKHGKPPLLLPVLKTLSVLLGHLGH